MNTETSHPRFQDLFAQHTGKISDKWAQFLDIYQRELGPMVSRGAALELLEIGVQNGGALEIWHKYFPHGSRLVGIDIDPRCQELEMPPSVDILIADVSDDKRVAELLGDGVFDIIIDDGSHQQHDMLQAFLTLFDRLKPGGKYFIEDLHACYWTTHGGGFRTAGSMIEYLKTIVDALHVDYIFDATIDQKFTTPETAEIAALKKLNADIASITFYDSVAVIEKYPTSKQERFKRVITGETMQVTDPLVLARVVAQNMQGFTFYGRSWQSVATAAIAAAEQVAGQRATELATVRAELAAIIAAMDALSQGRLAEEARIADLIAENLVLRAALRNYDAAGKSDLTHAPDPIDAATTEPTA